MPPKAPRVSIVVPTYNRETLLRRALGSVFSQTFTDWELVVMNDASTDGTRAYLEELAKRDPRVRPVHNVKNNYPDISKNLNLGLEHSRGEYIARVDDDDYWCDDEKLAKQVAYLDAHPDCMVCGGGTIVVDGQDHEQFRYCKPETDEVIRMKALIANPFTHSTVMFRRVQALQVGGYAPYKNAEDWDLWLRLGLRGTFYNFQEYFVRYVMNEASKTFIFKRSQSREIMRLVIAHRKEYPRFAFAFAVTAAQLCYSMLPLWIRRPLYHMLSRAKRNF